MKILLVVTGLPDTKYPARSVYNIKYAEALQKRGHQVSIIYLRSVHLKRFPSLKYDLASIPVYEFSAAIPPVFFIKKPIFLDKLFSHSCKKTLKELKEADIVHGIGGNAAVAAYIIANRLKTNFGIQFIGSDVNVSLKDLKKDSLFISSLQNASFLSFNSDKLKVDFQSQINVEKKCRILYRGVNLDEYIYNYVETENSFNILFLGGFVGENANLKGGKTLLEAINILNDKIKKGVKFYIGGPNSDQYKDSFEGKKINENVIFLGAVPKNKVKELFQKSHVVIIPSLMEGLPNVLYESMASGNIIIASDVGGIPEVIQDKVNGFLIKADNGVELAECLKYVIDNSGDLEHIARSGRDRAKDFKYESFVEGYLELYKENLN